MRQTRPPPKFYTKPFKVICDFLNAEFRFTPVP